MDQVTEKAVTLASIAVPTMVCTALLLMLVTMLIKKVLPAKTDR